MPATSFPEEVLSWTLKCIHGALQQHSYSLGRVQIFPLFFYTWRQQGCFCTRLFTRLLQGCLQGCYKVVTRLFTRLLQGCYKVVTRLFPCQLHTCNQVVTRLLHNLVATLLQGCYNLVFSVWACYNHTRL